MIINDYYEQKKIAFVCVCVCLTVLEEKFHDSQYKK